MAQYQMLMRKVEHSLKNNTKVKHAFKPSANFVVYIVIRIITI
jgi:hypothetical protein